MQFDTSILLYAAILIAVVAFVEGLYLLVADLSGGADKHVNRRLRLIARQADQRAAYDLLRPKSLAEGASSWFRPIINSTAILSFEDLVTTSGIGLSTQRVLVLMSAAFVGVVALLELAAGIDFVSCIAGAAVLAIGLPVFVISRIRKRRIARFADQLPDALDMLVRSLKAGHPIPTGIGAIARELPDPIGTEFGLVYDSMSYGLDLRAALEKMGERLRLFEIDYMIVAMRIQHGTGGNLAEVLSALAGVIRERHKLRAKIKALSAEARLSGKVLTGLPIFVVTSLLIINPHYYDAARTNTLLATILAGAAALCLTGMLLLRRFVRVRL